MSNLKQLLTKPLSSVSFKAVISMVVVAFLGFADAMYLVIEHFQNKIPPCLTGGCEVVLSSKYSVILGIPVPVLGAVFYLLMLIGLLAYVDSKNEKVLKAALILSPFGFLFTAWFLYVQAFILHAYCQYCLGSAATSTTLFIIALFMLNRNAREQSGI